MRVYCNIHGDIVLDIEYNYPPLVSTRVCTNPVPKSLRIRGKKIDGKKNWKAFAQTHGSDGVTDGFTSFLRLNLDEFHAELPEIFIHDF